jgi:hypothetical protein
VVAGSGLFTAGSGLPAADSVLLAAGAGLTAPGSGRSCFFAFAFTSSSFWPRSRK